jgi:hypothetical protein
VFGDQRPRLISVPQVRSSAGKEAVALAARAGLHLDDWESWVLDQALGEDDHQTYLDSVSGELRPMWAAFEVALIVSRQNGKGAILEARELAGLFLFGERLIIHTAHEFKTCNEAFRRLRDLIMGCPELARRVTRVTTSHGEEGIELDTGQRIRFLARSGSSGRGFTCDLLIYDEAMVLDAHKVGATLPTLSARPNPQVWYTASAGDQKSTQLAKVRRRGVAGSSPGLAFMEWSAEMHDEYCRQPCREKGHLEPDDIRAWAQANPALGIRITARHIERERDGMGEAEFARERLGVGIYPAPEDGWAIIPEKWWRNTLDPSPDVIPDGPCFSIDIDPGRTSATIAVAGKRPDRLTQIEIAAHKHGTKWVIDQAVALDRKWRPVGWAIDPRSEAGALIEALEQAGLTVIPMTAQDVAHAFGLIYDGFRDSGLRHPDQEELKRAIAGSEKRKLSEGSAWDRFAVSVNLSPLIAATLAHWGHWKLGADIDYDVGDSVGFDHSEIIRMVEAGYYGPDDLNRLLVAGALDLASLAKLAEARQLPPALVSFLAAHA